MEPARPVPAPNRASRLAWRLAALLVAAAVGWLAVRGWQQPGLLLDLANMRLC